MLRHLAVYGRRTECLALADRSGSARLPAVTTCCSARGTLTTVPSDRSSDPDGLGEWVGQVHCGDAVTVMNQMPAGSVDLVVTSPPYNLLVSTGNGMVYGKHSKWPGATLRDGYDSHDDKMPTDEYVGWQRECLAAMLRVVHPDTGAVFYNHKWRVQGGLLERTADRIVDGFPVRQVIIWRRAGGINFNAGYFLPTYEVVYLIARPKFQLSEGVSGVGDVWDIPQDTRNPQHPAPFPVELARRCVAATDADVVLDPFIGSGTTAVAAAMEGRQWVGIDLSERYCQVARERVAAQRTGAPWPPLADQKHIPGLFTEPHGASLSTGLNASRT